VASRAVVERRSIPVRRGFDVWLADGRRGSVRTPASNGAGPSSSWSRAATCERSAASMPCTTHMRSANGRIIAREIVSCACGRRAPRALTGASGGPSRRASGIPPPARRSGLRGGGSPNRPPAPKPAGGPASGRGHHSFGSKATSSGRSVVSLPRTCGGSAGSRNALVTEAAAGARRPPPACLPPRALRQPAPEAPGRVRLEHRRRVDLLTERRCPPPNLSSSRRTDAAQRTSDEARARLAFRCSGERGAFEPQTIAYRT
jgi:hypothetical protein